MNKKKNILLVDDDIDVLEQLSLILRNNGYDLVTAQGREEAEEAMMSSVPDLAIVDLMMEEMDAGLVLCHEIKKMYPGTPVIIHSGVTASAGVSFPTATADARSWFKADAFMDKPVRQEQLISQVRHLLAETEHAAGH